MSHSCDRGKSWETWPRRLQQRGIICVHSRPVSLPLVSSDALQESQGRGQCFRALETLVADLGRTVPLLT